MELTYEYWFMLPVAVLFSTTAMASGVEGATFFTPTFILALGLPAEIAIGTGLITEVFGFASGLTAYARRGLIDYRLGASLLAVTVPMALLGAWVAGLVAADILKAILGTGLFAVAASFLRTPEPRDVAREDAFIEDEYGSDRAETCLITRAGERICYTVCNRTEGRALAGVGALFLGMISTGLGELSGYFLLRRCRVPSRVAVATSVFVVAVTALLASTGHFIKFAEAGGETLATVLGLVMFTVPGAIIGGQIGPFVASRISQHTLERSLAVLFILVAALMIGEVALRS